VVSIGLVFLDDLHAFGAWISDRAPAWARARGLEGARLSPRITPPPITIVVARTLTWSLLEVSAAWLRLAEHVIVVLDPTDDPTTKDPDAPELDALQREQFAQELQGRVHFIEAPPGTLERAIDEALRLARETPVRGAWTPYLELSLFPAAESGPWIDWTIPRSTSFDLDVPDVLRFLAPALCRPGGRPAVLDGLEGTLIDLQTGRREAVSGLAGKSSLWRPIAAMPDGTQWLTALDRHGFRLEDAKRSATLAGGWGSPIGVDPGGQIAWAGGRCWFHFRVVTDQGLAYWTPSNHDWPCGHGKKLYGYKDNDPLFVNLAADASACLSTYEHDTLLTPQLPLAWRDVGGFALAERMRGEPRALLFCHSDGDDAFPGDPFQADEDVRDEFAVATLGPSPEMRYAVSLEKPTYRLAEDHVVRLGGPDDGWIICNDRHEIVGRSSGRLLGGWGRWVVVEREGALHREDIVAGSRELLGFAGHTIMAAVPLAGSPNVVLVNVEKNQPRVRLV